MKKETNYYFEIISPARAKALFQEGKTEIYKIYDDSEALIEDESDLNKAIEQGLELGLQKPIG